eukprot:10345271-Lingulodinium_polyedra.AAC.1
MSSASAIIDSENVDAIVCLNLAVIFHCNGGFRAQIRRPIRATSFCATQTQTLSGHEMWWDHDACGLQME